MTGKIRLLMESTAVPPMAQYSIETKATGSAATPMSSLETMKKISTSQHEIFTKDRTGSTEITYQQYAAANVTRPDSPSHPQSISSETTWDFNLMDVDLDKENNMEIDPFPPNSRGTIITTKGGGKTLAEIQENEATVTKVSWIGKVSCGVRI